MRIFDFFIYYTARYFTKNSYLLSWSTAVERACYATAIAITFWGFTFWGITVDYILKETKKYDLNPIPMIIAGFSIMILFQHIYIDRNRYELISSENYRPFRVKEERAILIVIIFNIISFVLPFALAIYTGITNNP